MDFDRFRFVLLLVALGFASVASAVEVGQTFSEVEAELGRPVNQLDAPGRKIARWADLEVIFEDGRVKSFIRRDLAAEAASEERRKQAAETARKLREKAEQEARLSEEERLAQDERERPERERKAQAEKIAALEAQLEIERRKLQELTEKLEPQQDRERLARMATLRNEIATLRMDIPRAISAGEADRAVRLRNELLAKERELNLLARKTQ